MKEGRLDDSRYLHTQSYCLYTPINSRFSWDGEKFSNTQGITVVVPRGYSIISFLEKRGIQVYEINTTDQAVMFLSNHRADGLVSLCLTAEAVLNRQKGDREQIVKASVSLQSKKYYVILSKQFVKQYPELSNKIWRISREVGKNYYPAIAQKYIRQE